MRSIAPAQGSPARTVLNGRYQYILNLHPEQLAMWPEAHEEFPDKEGFTTEGAWAGGNSVISLPARNAMPKSAACFPP